MAELINKNVLLDSMDDRYKAKRDIVPDNLAEGFLQMEKLIKEQPATTEAEIRAKAIEEFAEKLKAELLDALIIFSERREMYEIESEMGKMYSHGIGTLKGVNHMVDEIAEQLKEE